MSAAYCPFKGSRKRNSEEMNEVLFKNDLQELCDIAHHQEAVSLMTNHENTTFLIMQQRTSKVVRWMTFKTFWEKRRLASATLLEASRKQKKVTSCTASCTYRTESDDGEMDDPFDTDY